MTDLNSDIVMRPEPGERATGRLPIEIVDEDGTTRVAPAGELDLATVDDLAEALATVHDRGVSCVVLDLRGLTFIDSVGIGLLLAQRRHAAATGHRFELIEGAPDVQRTLGYAGITRLFAMREQ